MVKKHKNTVFGYKKGSKTKSEKSKIFLDPKLYIETFCTFVKNLIVFVIFRFLGFLGFFGKDLCIKWSKNTKNTFFEKMSKIGFGHMVPGMSITDTKHYFCPKGSPNSLQNNFESISDPNLEYTTKNLKFPRVKIGIYEIALYYGDFDQK